MKMMMKGERNDNCAYIHKLSFLAIFKINPREEVNPSNLDHLLLPGFLPIRDIPNYTPNGILLYILLHPRETSQSDRQGIYQYILPGALSTSKINFGIGFAVRPSLMSRSVAETFPKVQTLLAIGEHPYFQYCKLYGELYSKLKQDISVEHLQLLVALL
jgi:hypothetical protein